MPFQVIDATEAALTKGQELYTSSIQARPSKAVPPLMEFSALRPDKVCLRAAHHAMPPKPITCHWRDHRLQTPHLV